MAFQASKSRRDAFNNGQTRSPASSATIQRRPASRVPTPGSRLQRPSSPIREQPKKNKNTRYLVHDSDDEIENEESENEQYDRTEEDPEQLEDSRTQTARSQANSKNPRQFNRKHQQLELVRREVARQNASNTVDHQPKSSIGKKRKHQQLDEDDEDGENHAFQAGKKFTVHYYMWGNKEQIFGNWEGRNLIKGTAEKHLGRSVQAFKQENLELCEGWGTRKYQAEFMRGMSRMRSNMKDGIQQYPQEAFGLKVDAREFITKPRNRMDHPEIEALVKRNRAFRDRDYQSDIDDEGAGDLVQMFRHHCILSMLRRTYFGPKAVLTGTRSSMARSPFAHRWGTKHVVPPAIAFAATMCRHILDGTEDLSNPTTSVVYYDDTLRKLINLRTQYPNAYDSLMGYYNRALEFVKEEEVDEFSDEEERETWRRLQMRPNADQNVA